MTILRKLIKQKDKRIIWIASICVVVVALGGSLYYFLKVRPAQTPVEAAQSSPQTATVRRGDLELLSTGSGELISAAQVEVGFSSGGVIEEILVSVGDVVEEGQLLAVLDDTAALNEWVQAQRTYADMTSPAAVAAAKEALAVAKQAHSSARYTLEYMISPTVVSWERQLVNAQEDLKEAQSAYEDDPSDENEQAVKDAESAVAVAEKGIDSAWYYYENEYIYTTFEIVTVTNNQTKKKTQYVNKPSDVQIQKARAEYELTREEMHEAEEYLKALNKGVIPADATGDSIIQLEQAQMSLESANQTLEETKLYSPISGTILSLDAIVGETVSSSAIMTIADLTNLQLNIYLDSSDWNRIAAGYEVEVVFDALPTEVYTGTLIQIDSFLTQDIGATVLGGLVQLDQESIQALGAFPLGMTARIDVIGGRAENAVLVPVEALHQISEDQYNVFVMENGELKVRMVEIGIMDLFYAEVLSGLQSGEVVTTGIVETE
ncbi:MAG: efflux RND transporter periplasmic adaptor subunit [Anaerolineales bacterium]|jgi:HlyD family secretion protein